MAYVGLVGNYPVIRTADLDRVHSTTLTRRPFENGILYPVWSPDGSQIAFLTDWRLTLVSADGSNQRMFEHVQSNNSLAWSPDGSWLAITESLPTQGDVSQIASYYTVLTLVRPDGSDLTRVQAVGGVTHENQKEPAIANSYLIVLGSLASVPAWSPDGSQIAFFQAEKGSVALYTVELAAALQERPIEARKLLSIDIEIVPRPLVQEWIWYTTLSWSPDGTALLYASERVPGRIVSVEDGSVIADVGPGWAAWSPDGARIAVVASISVHFTGYGTNSQEALPALREVLYTMARDGTDKRVLVRGNLEQFVAARSDE